jgi:hypothetical protein
MKMTGCGRGKGHVSLFSRCCVRVGVRAEVKAEEVAKGFPDHQSFTNSDSHSSAKCLSRSTQSLTLHHNV